MLSLSLSLSIYCSYVIQSYVIADMAAVLCRKYIHTNLTPYRLFQPIIISCGSPILMSNEQTVVFATGPFYELNAFVRSRFHLNPTQIPFCRLSGFN